LGISQQQQHGKVKPVRVNVYIIKLFVVVITASSWKEEEDVEAIYQLSIN